MAYSKQFRGTGHQCNTFDRFEKPILKIMRDAAKKALDDAGIKYRVGGDGALIVTEQHLAGEKWEHQFCISIAAQYAV